MTGATLVLTGTTEGAISAVDAVLLTPLSGRKCIIHNTMHALSSIFMYTMNHQLYNK